MGGGLLVSKKAWKAVHLLLIASLWTHLTTYAVTLATFRRLALREQADIIIKTLWDIGNCCRVGRHGEHACALDGWIAKT